MVANLTADSKCSTSVLTVDTAGTDPVFQTKSTLYNEELDAATCYPSGGLTSSGFPFVRFPTLGTSLSMQWGAAVNAARARAVDNPDFFNVSLLSGGERDSVDGGFPVFFDCRFDHARALRMLDYMHDGFYLTDTTTSVTAKVLLFNQETNFLTFLRATFSLDTTSGAVKLDKQLSVFKALPYDDGAWAALRMVMEALYALLVLVSIFLTLRRTCNQTVQKNGRACACCADMWNLVDLATIALQVCVGSCV